MKLGSIIADKVTDAKTQPGTVHFSCDGCGFSLTSLADKHGQTFSFIEQVLVFQRRSEMAEGEVAEAVVICSCAGTSDNF